MVYVGERALGAVAAAAAARQAPDSTYFQSKAHAKLNGAPVQPPVRAQRSALNRRVSFNEHVETHETYELYRTYFSEYDRRSRTHAVRLTDEQVTQIEAEVQSLRQELFPDGRCFGDREVVTRREGEGRAGSEAGKGSRKALFARSSCSPVSELVHRVAAQQQALF
eukprot:comp24053_c0_seq1/m.43184 comp24053_c0_seq1/g.43184  ORF comp24053_c0_seq1/g.43184 comp24053_c0_seq1/m.43184 type:complete len:166 (-) comp24053_c0_seq1:611-1108(-)